MTDETISAERGQFTLTISDKSYPMRPSGAAQMAIEDALGTTITELYFCMESLWRRARGEPASGVAGLTLKQMSVVLAECVKAAGKDRGDKELQSFQADRVAELIADHRSDYNKPIMSLLLEMLQKDDEKKA